MNPIVVATDFSPAADNAAGYAAQLAQAFGAPLLLLHVYEMPVSMNDVPIMMVTAEELREAAERSLQRTKEWLGQNYPNVEVSTEGRLGVVGPEVEDVCRTRQPLLVVVGKHGATGIERFLFGTSALSIIRHAVVPVLSVPVGVERCTVRQLALAVDDTAAEQHADFLQQLQQKLGAQLHIVHVKQQRDDRLQTEGMLAGLQPRYHSVTNEDFVAGLDRFVQQQQIDLIVILPHEHSWVERVFFKTHTAELLEKIRLPILSLPDRNKKG